MSFIAEVQNQMSWRANLGNRDHASNLASIRSNCMSKQVHACSQVNLIRRALLRNHVEAINISQKVIELEWLENHLQLSNMMTCLDGLVHSK